MAIAAGPNGLEQQKVFAFYKPKGMKTDLKKGGMADVVQRMMEFSKAGYYQENIEIVEPCIDGRVWPVGQLDKNTTGLMVFTNSGKLTDHLNNHVSKSYRVSYEGWKRESQEGATSHESQLELTEDECKSLLTGTFLEKENRHVCFDCVELRGGREHGVIHKAGETFHKFMFTVDVSIKCGVFHVVKRILKNCVGKSVHALHRFRVGDLLLEDLGLQQPGDFCELTVPQKQLLWKGDCECVLGMW
eukprot:gnl/MRDRNA2_/MRDRNA2_158107_c0_seq1.p1 gnl/MRDRNA2_/MRDRNA2_158107_c0~~gnl/MRDRNA2_/MRDRNA2_158107_c0_seq1.p1  ORF type:complete len:245 (-),score=37.75 gnl/MRDRNA2_/MRDRNA2_158107_c0_seq1:30-764(-)